MNELTTIESTKRLSLEDIAEVCRSGAIGTRRYGVDKKHHDAFFAEINSRMRLGQKTISQTELDTVVLTSGHSVAPPGYLTIGDAITMIDIVKRRPHPEHSNAREMCNHVSFKLEQMRSSGVGTITFEGLNKMLKSYGDYLLDREKIRQLEMKVDSLKRLSAAYTDAIARGKAQAA